MGLTYPEILKCRECKMHSVGLPVLDKLINELSKLPGIGHKTAQRLALFILKEDGAYVSDLADALLSVKENTQLCSHCFNISEHELCTVCLDTHRDAQLICVVEDIVDIIAIEESHEFKGLYHVLGGVISPLGGTMPEDLHLNELLNRVKENGVKEVLLAINPSTEGEATMIYISRMLKDFDVRITRIASGVPLGSHLEFLDTATIGRAILTRREL